VIIFDAVYDKVRGMLLDQASKLRVGVGDEDDFGPVISREALDRMLACIEEAKGRGAKVLAGGGRLTGKSHEAGFYLAPTILENVTPADPLSTTELFGPVTVLHRVKNLDEALALANGSPFGLTAAIHTASIHRAMVFQTAIQAGVAVVNGPTYGSEPHMPFGGLKRSGNGFREAGSEALDVFSD
jgi:aldehyde dehydrogenase (NAD+)